MTVRVLSVLAVLALVVIQAGADDEKKPSTREQDARKDLSELQGTWQLESLQTNAKSKVDVKKRTLFIGGELFLVRDGEKVLQAGVLRLTTSRSPRRIDVTVRQGQHADNTMLGIYELKGDTLKVCFDPEGETRPAKFAPKEDTAHFLAVYKRAKVLDESIDIVRKYKSESSAGDGKQQMMGAEIENQGDAYLVRWTVPGGVAYIGSGIRQGSTLSVAWVNRGSIGLSVYQIEKGPKLTGLYTEVGGPGLVAHEVLLPAGKEAVEVRLRPVQPAK